MKKTLISIGKASEMLDVTISTLRNWERNGKLIPIRTLGKHRKYDLRDIEQLQGIDPVIENNNAVCCYCRVSSNDQKQHGDLDRQKLRILEYCSKKGYTVQYILEDCCSGMKYNRPKLDVLYDLVIDKKINKIIIEHKDRLVRFGFDCLKVFFNSYDVEIEYIEDTLPKSFENELCEDIISIITSFSARLHSRRKKQSRDFLKNGNQEQI